MQMNGEVILVHGLWFGSWAMARLDRNLRAEGFAVRRFAYATTAGSLAAHSLRLADFARESRVGQLHFVAHSLGGLVTLRMLAAVPGLPAGRVVLLGSPLDGSVVARKARHIPGADRLLGDVRADLERGYSVLPEARDTGMIAGSRSMGLGLLLGGAGRPGDGTVAVSETRKTGLTDHLVLPVTHTGMLYSGEVARQSAGFLKTGRFAH
jgi:pimeloyl-ACP methyl ester carboxylesterase